MATWRDSAKPIIARTIWQNRDKSEKEIRAALREAYPFGVRDHHPYRIWCDEVKKQLRGIGKGKPIPHPDPQQQTLF